MSTLSELLFACVVRPYLAKECSDNGALPGQRSGNWRDFDQLPVNVCAGNQNASATFVIVFCLIVISSDHISHLILIYNLPGFARLDKFVWLPTYSLYGFVRLYLYVIPLIHSEVTKIVVLCHHLVTSCKCCWICTMNMNFDYWLSF